MGRRVETIATLLLDLQTGLSWAQGLSPYDPRVPMALRLAQYSLDVVRTLHARGFPDPTAPITIQAIGLERQRQVKSDWMALQPTADSGVLSR